MVNRDQDSFWHIFWVIGVKVKKLYLSEINPALTLSEVFDPIFVFS